jgi:hypothetical protein
MKDIYTSRAKDAVLSFLQNTFSLPGLFRNQPNSFRYSDDEKSTRIMIADYTTENLNSVNVKPAILVQRGNITPQQISIGDKTMQSFLMPIEERQLLLNVAITIHCYSREGLEAELLSVIVFKLIRYLNEDIQKASGIFDIQAQGIGAEQKIRPDLVDVPVFISVSVPDRIRINFHEIQLSTFSIKIDGQKITEIGVDS